MREARKEGSASVGPCPDLYSRIAQLHRELAEAYEELARDEQRATRPKTKKAPAQVKPTVEPSAEDVAAMRRTLRRKGLNV